MSVSLRIISALLILLCFVIPGWSQKGFPGILYLEDYVYDYLDYRITGGKANPAFILLQPYAQPVLKKGMRTDKWGSAFLSRQAVWGDSGRAAFQLLPEDGGIYRNGALLNRYGITGGLSYAAKHMVIAHRTSVKQYYKEDPNYAGDLSESEHWIYGRVNDAYLRLRYGGFIGFIGKMKRNWGPLNEYSLILSDFPYTYEHVMAGYQNDWLSFLVLFARLEDMPAYGIYPTAVGDTTYFYPSARKFLVGHRFDIRFSRNFQIGLSEMATYGGPNRDMEWEFLNPMTFYYGLQRNDQRVSNGRWTLDFFWRPRNRWAIYGQFMIDDVIVNNDPGVDDRGRYPDRLAVLVSARKSDFLLNKLFASVTYTRIWNRTYQSQWTYENYHYRGLGLGYPAAGLEEVKLRLNYWGLYPFYVKNETIIGRYGAVALTDIFPLKKEPFPVQPVIHNVVNIFELVWLGNPLFRAGIKVSHFKDARHYLNRLNEGSAYAFELKFSYLLGVKWRR